jgi:hypothetical protein
MRTSWAGAIRPLGSGIGRGLVWITAGPSSVARQRVHCLLVHFVDDPREPSRENPSRENPSERTGHRKPVGAKERKGVAVPRRWAMGVGRRYRYPSVTKLAGWFGQLAKRQSSVCYQNDLRREICRPRVLSFWTAMHPKFDRYNRGAGLGGVS